MPWVWVTVGLIVWTAAALAVIGLCISARRIDARLDRGAKAVGVSEQPESRVGVGADVE